MERMTDLVEEMSLRKKKISDFVTRNSMNFFERFQIPTDFLLQPVETWVSLHSYKEGLEIVNQIKVINDTAER